jgi:RNA recognition motif-containing protein
METKLYVGNLSYSISEAELQTLFSEVGTVKSVQLIQDRNTGRSKGFAFVEMGTQEEAQKAISQLNGKEVGGRPLTVNLARPREERSSVGGGRDTRRSGGFSGGRSQSGGGSGGGGSGGGGRRRSGW